MINIYEYLLSKTKKNIVPNRPKLGSSINDIIDWIKYFNIKEYIDRGKSPYYYELFYEVLYNLKSIKLEYRTKTNGIKYYCINIELNSPDDCLISWNDKDIVKRYHVCFDDIMKIAENVMLAANDGDKIIDIMLNYKKYI